MCIVYRRADRFRSEKSVRPDALRGRREAAAKRDPIDICAGRY